MVKSAGPKKTKPGHQTGLEIASHFVSPGENPYEQVLWKKARSEIRNHQGEVVFDMEEVEAPDSWSQLAIDIAASKYFRKNGVPEKGHETSVKQLVYRVANTIRKSGEKQSGYFKTAKDAEQFENELAHILLTQKGAFNSPVWFNCGLWEQYQIQGSPGQWIYNESLDSPQEIKNSYEYPQCSACFIQSVDDDLMSIFDLAKKEARIFKYGSGSGTNFSPIRGKQERLSGGGYSSGLISFLEVLDRGAGATKSGGTTRRAAKMVCLDIDHPEIFDFVNWKKNEEKKVRALIGAGYSSDFNGEAYRTVSGQNSNNSIRVTDSFMKAVENDDLWQTKARTNDQVIDEFSARLLWNEIGQAAWTCADPGIQFDSTIQAWHTCPQSGRINSSNPCSEYMFLDNSACNLASVNLIKFLITKEGGHQFDIEGYRHTCRILFLAQEILVDHSSYPTPEIAYNSHRFRPLGLGYANLGSLLMVYGLPYDSEKGRTFASSLTAILTGEAYALSAKMAASKGTFTDYPENAESMKTVIEKHRQAVLSIDSSLIDSEVYKSASEIWNEVVGLGEQYGYRNSQATVLAPTGTIGLLMDCDTTGVEPDFALVKYKKLSGGGYFKIVNKSVPGALKALGYTDQQSTEIISYATGSLSLDRSRHIHRDSLKSKGFSTEEIDQLNKTLKSAYDLESIFRFNQLNDQVKKAYSISADDPILQKLGFSRQQIDEANSDCCGHMTLEGAPYLKTEHYAVFDCANKCGDRGSRYIKPIAHIQMMAAIQPFISGAISKTVNLPTESRIEDILYLYKQAWHLGLKAVAVYRDGSKISQPLSSNLSQSNSSPTTTTKDRNEHINEEKLKQVRQRSLPLDQEEQRKTLEGNQVQQLSELMGDAPMCAECGHVTVRNGSCYRCLNCGHSMGCS